MQQTLHKDNQFVVDLLTMLQRERFSPLAWWHFLQRSWSMACETANGSLALKRSWMRISMLIAGLTLGICGATYFFEGMNALLHLLPGFLFCVSWQLSDLFWHLGLNRQARTGKLLQSVGIANTLTVLRGLGASFLLGRLIGELTTPTGLALFVFALGVITDILDGPVARYTNTQSTLGQIADGEADFCLYLALSVILIQDAILPLWLGIVMGLRFIIPLLAALASYFLFAHPVRFGSTIWGKCAGVAQCLYFFVLRAPPQITFITRAVNMPLLIATVVLLIVAPIAQFVENVRNKDIRQESVMMKTSR